MLGISKRGDVYLRKLIIHGARAALRWTNKKHDQRIMWAASLKERRGQNIAAELIRAEICSEFHQCERLPSLNNRPDICMQQSLLSHQTLSLRRGTDHICQRNSQFLLLRRSLYFLKGCFERAFLQGMLPTAPTPKNYRCCAAAYGRVNESENGETSV